MSTSYGVSLAAPESPVVQEPSALSRTKVRDRFVTAIIGTRSAAPAAAARAAAVRPALRSLGMITAETPTASAVRRHAPRLCGSCTRSEEHTSELQSLMRTSYAVFRVKKKKNTTRQNTILTIRHT